MSNIRPTLNLQFAETHSLDSLITFVRNTPATFVNSKGLIEVVANNEPRFGYDPYTRKSLGLLIEEARTNYIANSALSSIGTSATNNAWFETLATVDTTVNYATCPDGSTSAALLSVNTTTTNAYIEYRSTQTTTGSYVLSFWAKPNSTDTNITALLEGEIGSTNYAFCQFALTGAGSASSVTLFGNAANTITPTVQPYRDGWYRCSLIVSLTSPTNVSLRLYPGTRLSQTTASKTLVWGAQLEQGYFVTSLIPTTSAAATRNADFATITGSNFTKWYNTKEGTCCFDMQFSGNTTNATIPVAFTDGTLNERIYVITTGLNYLRYAVVDGNVNQLQLDPGTPFSIDVGFKYGFVYATNYCGAVKDCSSLVLDTSCTLPTVTALYFCQSTGGVEGSYYIASFTYYPKRVSDVELQGLTL